MLLAGVSLLAASVANAIAAPGDSLRQAAEQASNQRYIIKYKEAGLSKEQALQQSKATKQQALAALSSNGERLSRQGVRVHKLLAKRNALAAELNPVMLARLKADPTVEYVERDLPRFPMMQQIPYGFTMVQADQVSDEFASNQTVCVIDSGLGLPHEDFNAANITGSNDIGTGNWFDAGGPHGTHVAGTIAALNNDVGIVGVMPNGHLKLHIVKVFNDDGWGYSSSLAQAVDTCAQNGATVINMSLGGAGSSVTERNAMQAAFDAGVLLIAAAGNDGNTAMSYPASYDSVVSVAAVDDTKTLADFSQRNTQVELAGPGVNVRSTYPEGGALEANLAVGAQSFDVIPMTGSGTANLNAELASCGLGVTTCTDVDGKICVIQRGEVAFAQKVESCQAGGGVGAIIYNNVSGNFGGTLGDNPTTTIAAVSVSLEDGNLLMNELGNDAYLFSGASNYGLMSGTSMASPHVAGVAALVWSHYPQCTNAQIRSALAATAEDLGTAGRDTSYGFGLVQAKAAVDYLAQYGCAGDDDDTPPPPPPTGTELVNGETVSALAGAAGDELLFTLNVPEGASNLSFVMNGGTGDADLYVKFGAEPTASDWDCRPYLFGNNESCPIDPAQAGTYFVKLIGYTAFADVNLTGSFVAPDLPDAGGETISNISVARRSWQHYTLEVPEGMAQLSVTIGGGRGDADLYVKYASQPSSGSYDCRPNKNGNEESCVIENPQAGTWHMSVYGYRAVTGLTLVSEYQP
ncbi:collagenolytic subtilisin-like serine protease [Rheinheimera nanhaiensis E407-8]|uniref:Collagenolytic subtilisin-like serine protease n=1 Tax=Rheinheimera nanhaiensis E407-8 TaxID=562729 RepID=I1DSM8_9GAMM|nr:collagenolytic subtilisin-like serine protease [Rheinheimera nanhaiensis E407-8]